MRQTSWKGWRTWPRRPGDKSGIGREQGTVDDVDPTGPPTNMHRGEVMTVQDETATSTHGVILTDAAATKAKALLDQEGRDDLSLRIAVQPGGCAGLRYNLFFDDRSLDGDLVAEFGGVALTVDRMSAPYVQGATVDFVDTIEKQGFTIDNPNATGSCACGDSFN